MVFLFQQERDTAFARLAVDPDHGIVTTAKIGRVNRQIRHFPERIRALLRQAFFDRILM